MREPSNIIGDPQRPLADNDHPIGYKGTAWRPLNPVSTHPENNIVLLNFRFRYASDRAKTHRRNLHQSGVTSSVSRMECDGDRSMLGHCVLV
jgi:hypothetical protein